ncbi:MAG: thioesterase family protein [Balneolaceae bacterium]
MQFPDKDPVIEFEYTLRSRYGETDKMGHVYHGRFLEYFEVARVEMIRSYGLSYKKMEDEGIMLPVIQAELEYKSPVYYDEEILIKILVFDTPSVRLQTFYQVFAKERNQLCVLGAVSLCFMSEETRRPCRAPQYFLESLNKLNLK